MMLKSWLASWKYPSILLFGMGVANIGSWIYFIALNLIVLDLTQSALAVSALYLLRPLATLVTNVWAGSLIDRMNKRHLMIFLDLLRAILIALLPLSSSLWYIYSLVFMINMAGSVFGPAAGTYMTILIPERQRQRFNSLNSLIGSGAFMVGPAIAGMLFVVGSPSFAIYINAAALFISGLVTILMPNIEKDRFAGNTKTRITWEMLKQDWIAVIQFYRRSAYIWLVCFLFSCVMVVMASAVDSLEAAFAKVVLQLSERDYGILVSIAGAGIIAGASMNTLIVKKVNISLMIGLGTLGVCLGYLVYAFSTSFVVAAAGFFVLAFFLAFANTGFYTFYQNNIPVEIMGRVGSMNGLIEAILIMLTTVVMGVAADVVSIKAVVIVGVLFMFMLGAILSAFVLQSSRNDYFKMNSES
ncbi:MFS transporter [Paenibacillus sp. MMS18-CY102]|uniref:MFS transporter n=1 Tax=Paenibacillus sp. MMS18-CY102 TaxID=2682849 RepID=UPI001365F314|nr:MFS transporter [Paenibacillus sp. MMS18-CY102]MWC31313.1 MFS transporter [Paenibacillus sp. MMS18-CY102]